LRYIILYTLARRIWWCGEGFGESEIILKSDGNKLIDIKELEIIITLLIDNNLYR